MSQDDTVDIAITDGLRGPGFETWDDKFFSFLKTSQRDSEIYVASISWVKDFVPETKPLRPGFDYRLSSSAKVKNAWRENSSPPMSLYVLQEEINFFL